MPPAVLWLLRGLFLSLIGLGSLADTGWGAIYRCTNAAGRQVFSNLRCPGAVLVVADKPRPQLSPNTISLAPRGLRAQSTRTARELALRPPRQMVGEPLSPLAGRGLARDAEAFAALPERGQLLCQRQPERCPRLMDVRPSADGR